MVTKSTPSSACARTTSRKSAAVMPMSGFSKYPMASYMGTVPIMAGDFSMSARRNAARLAAVRQVHDGLGAQLQAPRPPSSIPRPRQARSPEIPKFTFTFVRRPAPTPSGDRLCVADVRGNGDAAGSHALADEFGIAVLLLRPRSSICARHRAGTRGIDLRDGPDGGGRCGGRGGPRRFVDASSELPSLALPMSGFLRVEAFTALPLSLPGRHAAASSPV